MGKSVHGPISVSAPANSLVGATGTKVTFSTQYPFHKLDSTNPVSFQVITLFFNADTPTPAAGLGSTATNRTLVYSYPHGYKYIPSTWFLVSTDNFTSVKGSEGTWLVGVATALSPAIAIFEVDVDATNINFYIKKQWTNDGITAAPTVIGTFLTIRTYVFVEDLSGTMVPSHA